MVKENLMRQILPVSSIQGECTLDGDKSVSHRLALLSIINRGSFSATNFAMGDDVKTSLKVARNLGVKQTASGSQLEFCQQLGSEHDYGNIEIDCGNSGTTARLLCGILCQLNGSFKLSGDQSLSNRPMGRVIEPIQRMQADITGRNELFLPLHIKGKTVLAPIDFTNRKASAQVKSAVLLAGLKANGITTIAEPSSSRDHTERLLSLAKAPICINDNLITITGPSELYLSGNFEVPGDPSSAAFLAVAASIVPGSRIKFNDLLLNPSRIKFIEILKKMGAHIIINQKNSNWEPFGTIELESARLKGISIDGKLVPSLIDELPALAIAMAFAEGESMVSGASELRVKETDRISNLINQLQLAGIQCEERADGFIIQGGKTIEGGIVLDPYNDHRLAMAFSLLGLRSRKGIRVKNCSCIGISFPGFFDQLSRLSVNF